MRNNPRAPILFLQFNSYIARLSDNSFREMLVVWEEKLKVVTDIALSHSCTSNITLCANIPDSLLFSLRNLYAHNLRIYIYIDIIHANIRDNLYIYISYINCCTCLQHVTWKNSLVYEAS